MGFSIVLIIKVKSLSRSGLRLAWPNYSAKDLGIQVWYTLIIITLVMITIIIIIVIIIIIITIIIIIIIIIIIKVMVIGQSGVKYGL